MALTSNRVRGPEFARERERDSISFPGHVWHTFQFQGADKTLGSGGGAR